MEERNTNAAAGLVMSLGAARSIVWDTDDLSPTEGLILLRLLECTTGARAEASHAELAARCKLNKRTLTRLMPRLREAGWFRLEARGACPSWFHWSALGPLAAAWVTRGPRSLALSAATISDPWADDLEALRGARLLHRPRTSSRFEPSQAEAVARWFADLVATLAADTPELSLRNVRQRTASWVMKAWLQRPGNVCAVRAPRGYNARTGWSLKWFHHEMEELSALILCQHERLRRRVEMNDAHEARRPDAQAAQWAQMALDTQAGRLVAGAR